MYQAKEQGRNGYRFQTVTVNQLAAVLLQILTANSSGVLSPSPMPKNRIPLTRIFAAV
jgi:hypothetical protein